jgi:hypothetical protein
LASKIAISPQKGNLSEEKKVDGKAVTKKFQVVGMGIVLKAADQNGLKALWEYLQLRFRGWSYARKDDVRHWKKIINLGLAREGKDTIHFIRNEELRQEGASFVVTEEMMAFNPVEAAYLLVQAHYLRTISLTGRKLRQRKLNIRLVSNENCGGVCLDHMASVFNRTRSWASLMRRKMEKNGWCAYKRRYTDVTLPEAQCATRLGIGGKYHEGKGQWKREIVSGCKLIWSPFFKAAPKKVLCPKSGRVIS